MNGAHEVDEYFPCLQTEEHKHVEAARFLGPFPDEIGWGAVISRWILFGGIAGICFQLAGRANAWDEIAWCIGFILFTIACFSS